MCKPLQLGNDVPYPRQSISIMSCPRDDVLTSTVLANIIHTYNVWMLGVDLVATHEPQDDQGQFRVGYTAWVGILHSRCTSISRMGQVTGISSPHLVLVDGTSHHIKKLALLFRSVSFKNTSNSSEESEPLERLWSISVDDTSDTSSPESVDDYHGCILSQEEARAPSLQRRAQIEACTQLHCL